MRNLLIAVLAVHFLLTTVVCFRDTFWLIGRSATILPQAGTDSAREGLQFTTAALGQRLPRNHLLRQSLDLYLHATGTESGYGFFAPNVGGTSRLVFELYFADGHVAYKPANADPDGDSLRFASFVDLVSRTQSESLRDILIRSLAQPIWQCYPEVVRIRAILGTLSYPLPAERLKGGSAFYNFVGAYELSRPKNLPARENPCGSEL